MIDKIALVVTSISSPNHTLQKLSSGCQAAGYDFIVIGDEGSPPDFHLNGCNFFSLRRQLDTDLKFPRVCPTKHYSRKNIGYLHAIKSGATIIVETDDDNQPYDTFWKTRQRQQKEPMLKNAGWINIYHYFTIADIWPRGLPLQYVNKHIYPYESLQSKKFLCPIQQGLVDENPDVDAIYRLILPLPHSFRKDRRIILGPGCWCPFNSQNTTWYKETFALLYLPSFCSFRTTDIWRSFIAQRIAWANDWGILYHEPTVLQKRNDHNLSRDFADEVPGYLHNEKICEAIESLELVPGVSAIEYNLHVCYKRLCEMGFFDEAELDLLDIWIEDLSRVRACF